MKIIKTYKGQTETRQTRQENASYDMPFFPQKT